MPKMKLKSIFFRIPLLLINLQQGELLVWQRNAETLVCFSCSFQK